jgi:hypothetical protein
MATSRGSTQVVGQVTASLTTSLAFTSTDFIAFAIEAAAGLTYQEKTTCIIRYKDA